MFCKGDSQKFFLVLYVPHDNLVLAADGKDLAEACREDYVSDGIGMRRHETSDCREVSTAFNRVQGALCGQCVDLLLRVAKTYDWATLELRFFFEYHGVLVDSTKSTSCGGDDKTVKESVDLMNTTAENLLHRARTLITCCLDVNL